MGRRLQSVGRRPRSGPGRGLQSGISATGHRPPDRAPQLRCISVLRHLAGGGRGNSKPSDEARAYFTSHFGNWTWCETRSAWRRLPGVVLRNTSLCAPPPPPQKIYPLSIRLGPAIYHPRSSAAQRQPVRLQPYAILQARGQEAAAPRDVAHHRSTRLLMH